MRTRFTLTVCALTVLAPGAGHAQSAPADRSCGGLLCDMGIFGHKTPPPPPAPPPVVAVPAPPPPTPETKTVAAPEPAAKPKLRIAHRRAPPKVRSPAKAATATAASPVTAAAPAATQAPPSAPPRNTPLLFQTVDPRL